MFNITVYYYIYIIYYIIALIITVFIANASMTIDLSNKMNFYSPPSVYSNIRTYTSDKIPVLEFSIFCTEGHEGVMVHCV